MKPFLILALAALAYARPEAPLGGYSYSAPAPQPSSSYGAPSSSGLGHSGLSGGHGHGLGGGSGFGSSGLGFSGIGGGFGSSSSSFGGSSSGSSFGGSSTGASFGGAQSFSSAGGSSFGGSSFGSSGASYTNSGSSFGGYQSQAPLISKHVYVHVAPEEPEIQRPARINAPSQARKHYKIVFIKAPTAPTPTAAQVQLPQQDEEKTIIYVLSKKQEEQPDVQVQSAAPTTPTKPEVYFIKYNTKNDQGSGLSLSAGAAPSSSYGVPASISANAAAPSSSYGAPSSLSANAAAPSNSYGVPSANGGPY